MSENKLNPLSLLVDKFDVKLFDKVDFIKKCATGIALFTLLTGIITFENYRINYYNNEQITKKLRHENEEKINQLVESNKKIIEILEKQTKMLDEILENPLLNLSNIEPLTTSSSILSLSPVLSQSSSMSLVTSPKNNELCENNSENVEQTEKVNKEDLELLNECYDNLPCNNSKKITGINKLFNW